MQDLSDPENPRAEDYHSSEADLVRMVVSPDGTLAAYASDESGRFEIYIRSFPDPGGPTIVSEGGGNVPFWSPDGNTLYYATRVDGPWMAAHLQRDPVTVVVSRDTLFIDTSPVVPFQGSGLHPDGDRFILTRSVGTTDAEGAVVEPRLIFVQNFFEELKRLVPN